MGARSCLPSNEWGPGDITGDIKFARKGTGHITSPAYRQGQVSFLIDTSKTFELYMGLTLTLMAYCLLKKLHIFHSHIKDAETKALIDFYLVRKNTVQYGVKCIQYMGATIWNNLPVELRNSTSKFLFKNLNCI